jgi:hypothetical protein
VLLLSRVTTQLGSLDQVTPRVIESLFAGDFAFLEDLYRRINVQGHDCLSVTCPSCNAAFDVEPAVAGEPLATP